MKLINQSVEVYLQKDFSITGIEKAIEKAARVSYLSWDKITDDSHGEFVGRLLKNKEYRPLEFGTVHLKMNTVQYIVMKQDLCDINLWNPMWIHCNLEDNYYHCTLNFRYYKDIKDLYPDIENYIVEEDNEYYPKRYTAHFTIARGILDEFRTHIGFSHMASSTRYINLSKEKFGNELTIVKPEWADIPVGRYETLKNEEGDLLFFNMSTKEKADDKYNVFLRGIKGIEETYFTLLEEGRTPQEARDVLPLSIESHLFMCGFDDMWDNFFKLRCANNAHPMAQSITCEAERKMVEELHFD